MTALDPCSHFGPHLHVSIIGTDSLSCELTFNHRTLHGQCSVNGKTLLDFGDKKHEGNATEMYDCPRSQEQLFLILWHEEHLSLK